MLIEFKLTRPLLFWCITITMTLLVVIIIWRLLKKKREDKTTLTNEIEELTTEMASEVFSARHDDNETSKSIPPKRDEKIKLGEGKKSKPQKNTNTKEVLPDAKVEKTKSTSDILYVNYDITNSQLINTYPIFLYPKRGSIIRSHRFGNTKLRGFKEDSFQNSIESYFGDHFTVAGDIRLNTGKHTRPFEPDIAIIDNSNTNLRIDIEIDEPYAGITRQPTHCKGEDYYRDTYFIDRGWIVIRFSEYQVHTQEMGCLKFIAEVISFAKSDYQIPNSLVNQVSLVEEKLWDVLQAQKWEKINYRENYLNHNFNLLEIQEETIERDFDNKELEEEKLVNSSFIGVVDDNINFAYNLENKHVRDTRIKFYPEPHIYTIDEVPAPSASTVISKFFPEFDSYSAASRLNPNHELFGLEINKIVDLWNENGIEAAKKGTFLHEQIEKFYLGQEYENIDELHLFERFINDNNHIKPFRTEWRIFDEQFHIAGTIDLISKNSNGYEMYDWKRSKKIVNPLNGGPIKINNNQNGIGGLSDIHDTSYNRYALQQSMYKYILEKNYDIKVDIMYLVVLYPTYDTYYKFEVPYLKDKVEYILRTL